MSGICNVFILLDAETNQRICFLNVSPDEVIRSLFYNKNNDSLITVSVYASDNFSSLKCRSTRIEYVNSSTPPPLLLPYTRIYTRHTPPKRPKRNNSVIVPFYIYISETVKFCCPDTYEEVNQMLALLFLNQSH